MVFQSIVREALFLSILADVSFSMALQNGGHPSTEISDCEASSDFFVLSIEHALAIDELLHARQVRQA